jgi:hypothetical protein
MSKFVGTFIDEASNVRRLPFRGIGNRFRGTGGCRNQLPTGSVSIDNDPLLPTSMNPVEDFETVTIISLIERIGFASQILDSKELGAHHSKRNPKKAAHQFSERISLAQVEIPETV